MYSTLQQYIINLEKDFNQIPESRKLILQEIAEYIANQFRKKETVNLVYLCTHNSRRSQFGQISGALVSNYHGLKNIQTFSGGNEVTRFNENAISALKNIGFKITALNETENANPIFQVFFDDQNFIKCYSKLSNDTENPTKNFAAIMTCSDADKNCPFIPNASVRISTTYDDPKIFDGTENVLNGYSERFAQILRETLYTFSLVKN